jgi:NMD protein affecting ribosome stability and mRNA decay
MNLTREPQIPSGVGEGWEKIVEECDRLLAKNDPDYTISQIKEKFGGLRYYYDSKLEYGSIARSAMESIVTDAEQKAAVTCEQCGESGKIHDGHHWLRTLCGACEAERPSQVNWASEL